MDMNKLLISRYYLIGDGNEQVDKTKLAYYNAFLLSNFGIIVDDYTKLTSSHIELISDFMHLNVAKSFYDNPQRMRHYSKSELLVEQLVSYFCVENLSYFDRVELFSKELPEYKQGDEVKFRVFKIVDKDTAMKLLEGIFKDYCSYTRPLSIDEAIEFKFLFELGLYKNEEIKCKENIMTILPYNPELARFLDKKDLVKLSVEFFGESKNVVSDIILNKGSLTNEQTTLLKEYMKYVKDCPLSKRQSKYFNKLMSICGYKGKKVNNSKSPDKLANILLNKGDIVGAAKVYANNGSMLQRRIKMLLSRANPKEALEILELLPCENPIVLYQMVNSIDLDNGESRTFTFYKKNKLKVHKETEYEHKWRKSYLNDSTRKLLKDICQEKILSYYNQLPKLGKIYLDKEFFKISLPTNTSANGKGLDVLPYGSRVPIKSDYIRTFVHWKGIYDIDASILTLDENGNIKKIDFTNYSNKPYGNSILFSGDCRSSEGSEYFDIDLNSLNKKGYKYAILNFYGYSSVLNTGEIYCGYQMKDNLETTAWDPKNIEMQYRVIGDTRACSCLAIDIENKEMIILNTMIDSVDRVCSPSHLKSIKKVLNTEYLYLNMGQILLNRGELVETMEEADVIFTSQYCDLKDKQIIKPFEIEKLVKFINE